MRSTSPEHPFSVCKRSGVDLAGETSRERPESGAEKIPCGTSATSTEVFPAYAAYFRVSPFQRGNPSSLILKERRLSRKTTILAPIPRKTE